MSSDNFWLSGQEEGDMKLQTQLWAREMERVYPGSRRERSEIVEDPAPISDSYFERDAWRSIQRRRRMEAFRAAGQEPPFLSFLDRFRWLQWDVENLCLKVVARLLLEPDPSHSARVSSSAQNEMYFGKMFRKSQGPSLDARPCVEEDAETSVVPRPQQTKPQDVRQSASPKEARAVKHLLRFLAERGNGTEDAELGDFPFYETESPAGRARVSPTHRQMVWKLGHIARAAREARMRPLCSFRLDLGIVEFSVTSPQDAPPSQPTIVEAIEDLEEFVACQLEGEAESRYQNSVRARRW